MAEFITYKRWALRPGRGESELVELVRERIVPHFKKLHGCIRLELLRIEGTRSYLALQHWESRGRWNETTGSDYYRTSSENNPQPTSRKGDSRIAPTAIFIVGGVGDNRHERLV